MLKKTCWDINHGVFCIKLRNNPPSATVLPSIPLKHVIDLYQTLTFKVFSKLWKPSLCFQCFSKHEPVSKFNVSGLIATLCETRDDLKPTIVIFSNTSSCWTFKMTETEDKLRTGKFMLIKRTADNIQQFIFVKKSFAFTCKDETNLSQYTNHF